MAATAPHPVQVEMAFGADPSDPSTWVWTDLGDDPRRSPVSITRGRSDESSRMQPANCDFVLQNVDGRYTPHYPMSPHWPHVRRGTPVRVSILVDGTTKFVRFLGHVASWEPVWPRPTRRDDPLPGVAHVRVTAAGVTRRLGQGAPSLRSPLTRLATRPFNEPYLLAFWPCEDGRDASHAVSPLEGVPPMVIGDLGAFAGADDHPGSEPLLFFRGAGGWNGTVPTGPDLSQWRIDWFARWDEHPQAAWEMMQAQSRGTAARWSCQIQADGDLVVAAWDGDNQGLALSLTTTGVDLRGAWVYWTLTVERENASTVRWRLSWFVLTGPDEGIGFSVTNTFSGRPGRPTRLMNVFSGDEGPDGGFAVGQMIVSTQRATGWLSPADKGWPGERCGNRWRRLCIEEGLPHSVVGDRTESEPMGRQTARPLLDLLDECVDAGGLHYEQVDGAGLTFRVRDTLYRQDAQIAADMEDRELRAPFGPTEDDRALLNRVTVSRPDASELTVRDEKHEKAEQVYATSPTVNLETDGQAEQLAAWMVHLGTWDEMRTPQLALRPLASLSILAGWADARPGDRVVAQNLMRQFHGDVDALLEGWTETFDGFDWRVEANTSPGRPWQVGALDGDGTPDTSLERLASDGSTVTVPVSESGTSVDVVSQGPPWVDDTDHAGQFPHDVVFDTGEVVTVTACTQPVAADDVPVVHVIDGFDVDEADSWGAAEVGGPWEFDEVSNTELSVSGSAGRIVLTGTPEFTRQLVVGDNVGDDEVLLSFSVDQVATGDSLKAVAVLRSIPDGEYQVEALLDTAGDISLQAVDTVDGSIIDGPTATGVTYAVDDVLWLRARVDDGHRVRGRLWADSGSEPGSWLVDAVAPSETPSGRVGCGFNAASSSNTNVEPTLSAHSFEAWALVAGVAQTMTVTRATNGIVKTIPAGADVQTATPFRLAL